MTYTTTIAKRIDDLSVKAWDNLCAASPFTQYRWLRLLETTLAHYEPRYIQVWQEGQLVAGAICSLQRTFHMSVYLHNKLLRQAAGFALGKLPPFKCGLPIFARSGLVIHPSVDANVIQNVLLAAIEQVAKQERALFTGFDSIDPIYRSQLLAQTDYLELSLAPESYIDINWDSFEAYQADLPKKSRGETRRVRNRAQECGVSIETASFSPELSAHVEQLIRSVAEQHGNTYAYKADLLDNALRVLSPADYRLLLACHQGDIIGCVALFHSHGEVLVKWIGLDYQRTEPTFAYPYLMTDTVRHAIDMKAKRLTLGATVYTLKKKMGGVLEDRYLLMNLHHNPLNKLGRHFLRRQSKEVHK